MLIWDRFVSEFKVKIEERRPTLIRQLVQTTAEKNAKAMRRLPQLFDAVIGALASLCGNPAYNASSVEDTINDYIRDVLWQQVIVRKQTRQDRADQTEASR